MVKNFFSSDRIEEILIKLYKSHFEETPVSIERLTADGSPRRYFRLKGAGDKSSVIGTYSDNTSENMTFISFSKLFRSYGAKVPEVLAVSSLGECYLQEDLGDVSLFSCLKQPDLESLTESAIDSLVKIQMVKGIEPSEKSGLNRRQILWDLNYFKYEFLKPSGVSFSEYELEDDFERILRDLQKISSEYCGFMYRDFQSRNVMIHNGESWLIDYQGGGYGPILYDMVSFLWQARANFPESFRLKMMNYYVKSLSEAKGHEMIGILKDLPLLRLFRSLQVLGAYGFRGLVEHKSKFIEPIPSALENLSVLIAEGAADRYPHLKAVLERVCSLPRFKEIGMKTDGLQVTVFSFSYKKGYPEDLTGNGGGFMFDCRGMYNPGRLPEFKDKTGLDSEVIDFLEERGEVADFLANAFNMTSKSVENYLKRGFSSLQIGFGCTGGQHRSVYCAQHLAERVKREFPEAKVIVVHREQEKEEELK